MTDIPWYRRRDTCVDASGNRIPYETLRAALIGGMLRTGIPLMTYITGSVVAIVFCETGFWLTMLAMCIPFIVVYLYGFVYAAYDALKLSISKSHNAAA